MTGVVGVGHLGYHHARILGELTGAPVPVWDTDAARLADVSERLGASPTGSLGELLAACDAVVVATTTSSHRDVATRALSEGLHVLVEKPLSANAAEGREMVELARERGLTLAVGHVERFNPAVLAASDILDRPVFVEGHRMAPFRPRGTDVSVVMDLMIHDIDLVLSLIGSPVSEVHASGVPVLSGNVDIASARILFESGCVVNMTASRISREQMRRLRFFQPGSYVAVDFASREVDAYVLEGTSIRPLDVQVVERDALTEELRDFMAACSGEGRPAVTGADGLRALEVAQMISSRIEESLSRLGGTAAAP